MTGASEGVVWISAREAVNRLTLVFGGEAKAILVDRLRDGALTAKASRLAETLDIGKVIWGENKPDLRSSGKVNVVLPKFRPDKVDTLIDSSLWSRSASWETDQKLWQWGRGNFVVTLERKPPQPWRRIQMRGVQFDALEIGQITGGGTFKSETKSRSGSGMSDPVYLPPPIKWEWEDVLIDLVMVAEVHGLEDGIGSLKQTGGTTRLQNWFAKRFDEHQGEHPSKTELYLRARKVTRRLRNPHIIVPKG